MTLSKMISKIGAYGTEDIVDIKEIRRIQITNYSIVIAIFSIVVYDILFSLFYFKYIFDLLLILNSFIPLLLVSLFVNKYRYYLLAKILLMTSLTSFIFISTAIYLGTVSGLHFYFILFAISSVLLWSEKKFIYSIIFFIINSACFIYVEFFADGNVIYDFNDNYIHFIRLFSIITSLITILLVVAIYQSQSDKTAILLEEQKNEIFTQSIELERQRKNLEQLNIILKEKNEEVTNQRNQLSELNRIRLKLFSIVSHDLRNPFHSLLGGLDLLRKNINDYNKEEIIIYLNLVYNNTLKTFQLVENLLQWANIQQGSIPFKPEESNLSEIINTVTENLKSSIDQKEIKLICDINNTFVVNADVMMLSSIIRNLLTNAIKFSIIKGTIEIFAEKNYDIIQIIVKDNGTGISDDEKENLFKSDISYSSVGTANEIGTGLGLNICKEFVEKHGGKIWFESEKDIGSKFSFTIPTVKTI